MNDFAARIGRVRMKHSGCDVHVLDVPPPPVGLARAALGGVRYMLDDQHPVIAYMLVGLHADGRLTCSGACDFPDDGPLNRFGFVGTVTEATRAHLVTQREAVDVFNRE